MDVLQSLDADLNIYALANGMELIRNRGETPDRVLTWYSDGAERQIIVTAHGEEPSQAVDVFVGVGGGGLQHRPPEHTEPYREAIAPGELRRLLDGAVELANGLTRPPKTE